jgi:hypothetical protein
MTLDEAKGNLTITKDKISFNYSSMKLNVEITKELILSLEYILKEIQRVRQIIREKEEEEYQPPLLEIYIFKVNIIK